MIFQRKSQDFLRLHGRCSALPMAPGTFIIPPMEPCLRNQCQLLAAGSLQGAEKPLHTTFTPRAHHVRTTCTLEKVLEVLEALSF